MNQTQRKFLIERIQKKTEIIISCLKDSKKEYPSTSNYIFKAIMNNELKLQPQDVILDALKAKALKAKEGSNWLSNDRMGWNKERTVVLDINSLIQVPEDYAIEFKEVKDYNDQINSKIRVLAIQLDTIEVRVQLASDKTLSKLINDVDDMGDLKLIDTSLKLLS